MVFYHIDHQCRLKPGLLIVPDAGIVFRERWPDEMCLSVYQTFPDGLSNFGVRALLPTSKQDVASQHTLEFILEMVRLRSFPEKPSRLSSLFGMRDWRASSERWIERLEADASTFHVFECESDSIYTVDASFLDSPRSAGTASASASQAEPLPGIDPSWLSFPAALLHAARQYWLSCRPLDELSAEIPEHSARLEELLVPGPVRVIRQVLP